MEALRRRLNQLYEELDRLNEQSKRTDQKTAEVKAAAEEMRRRLLAQR
jgi:hypothetical protein